VDISEIYSKPKSDQYLFFDQKKDLEPVFKIAKNYWMVTDYDNTAKILRSKSFLRMEKPNIDNAVRSILDLDFDDHTKYRSLISQPFMSSKINILEIEKKISFLINECKNKNKIDILNDIAIPLPIMTISEILGLECPPVSDFEKIKEWSTGCMGVTDLNLSLSNYKKYTEDIENISYYLMNLFFNKKHQKTYGLINSLRNSVIDGRAVTDEEIFVMCTLIFVAGFETNVNAVTSGIYSILKDQKLLTEISKNKLKENISDEIIRHSSPICYVNRRCAEDYVVSDSITIPKGDLVILHLESANRDKSIFENPHEINFKRNNSEKHLAFGAGPHHCLGFSLAKKQIDLIIKAFFINFSKYQIEREPIRHPSYSVNGFVDFCVYPR